MNRANDVKHRRNLQTTITFALNLLPSLAATFSSSKAQIHGRNWQLFNASLSCLFDDTIKSRWWATKNQQSSSNFCVRWHFGISRKNTSNSSCFSWDLWLNLHWLSQTWCEQKTSPTSQRLEASSIQIRDIIKRRKISSSPSSQVVNASATCVSDSCHRLCCCLWLCPKPKLIHLSFKADRGTVKRLILDVCVVSAQISSRLLMDRELLASYGISSIEKSSTQASSL